VSAVGVIGAGAWGTAIAQVLASDGRPVLLWAREPEVVEAINSDRENPMFLPGVTLAGGIEATSDLAALANAATLFSVVPAQHTAEVLARLGSAPCDLVLCSKGIEQSSGRLMNEVAASVCPDAAIAVMSGPTFAHEVARGLPTAVTLACADGTEQWSRLSGIIARPRFRPYYSEDVAGAEVGGAVKNVLAIACGVAEGLELGQNARAALIARGYAEMMRFGRALGAKPETLAGLCGLGDLVLTCSSTSSRNFSLGLALGKGESLAAGAARRTVAEGAHTAPVLVELAARHGVAMPIVSAVYRLINGGDAAAIVTDLLARPLGPETHEGPAERAGGAEPPS
jgi:glycerol-3-phosphate dehydrogenase (NAD(P)+)